MSANMCTSVHLANAIKANARKGYAQGMHMKKGQEGEEEEEKMCKKKERLFFSGKRSRLAKCYASFSLGKYPNTGP